MGPRSENDSKEGAVETRQGIAGASEAISGQAMTQAHPVGISGSLPASSCNTELLRAAFETPPDGATATDPAMVGRVVDDTLRYGTATK